MRVIIDLNDVMMFPVAPPSGQTVKCAAAQTVKADESSGCLFILCL